MIPLTAAEVAAACAVETTAEGTVTGMCVDSPLVVPGDLFVALPGDHTDGARFAEDARGRGAALVVTASSEAPARDIVVPDPLIALGQIAAEVRRRSSAGVVGITGSTGKTSTKDILAALLAQVRTTVASPANYNTEIGLPLTLGLIQPETEVVVCELAMRGMGQIAYLAEICRPDVAVITGVGPAHLELLGTVEAVAEAKAEILDSVGSDGTAVVPHGERRLDPYLSLSRARIVTFGEAEGADVRLTGFRPGRAEFTAFGRNMQVPVSFTQRHNALNLAAALGACHGLGLPPERFDGVTLDVRFSPWRGEQVELDGGGVLIADCYNANPTSMEAALRHLVEVAAGRRTVAIIGDMAELGPTAASFHEQIGALARNLGVEVIAVGPLARSYGGLWFDSVETMLVALSDLVGSDDALLVKASRSMGLEVVVRALVP
jgi:UDP-N-acetylmuramoyl-tripeptide--D-alanyl-D-alanine ligase